MTIIVSQVAAVTLEWIELTYTVRVGKGKAATLKTILYGVSGRVRPGSLLAVMGPTGMAPQIAPFYATARTAGFAFTLRNISAAGRCSRRCKHLLMKLSIRINGHTNRLPPIRSRRNGLSNHVYWRVSNGSALDALAQAAARRAW